MTMDNLPRWARNALIGTVAAAVVGGIVEALVGAEIGNLSRKLDGRPDTLPEMIAEGEYDTVWSGFEESDIIIYPSFYTVDGNHTYQITADLSLNAILQEVAARGEEPSSIENLLAWGATNPKDQRRSDICAPGTLFGEPGALMMPCLRTTPDGERSLSYGTADGGRVHKAGTRLLVRKRTAPADDAVAGSAVASPAPAVPVASAAVSAASVPAAAPAIAAEPAANPAFEPVPAVAVPHLGSLNEMVTAGDFAYVHPLIDRAWRDVRPELYNLDGVEIRTVNNVEPMEYILARLKENGLRPASVERLLAWAKANPGRKPYVPVVAAGTVWPDAKGAKRVPFIDGRYGETRRLELGYLLPSSGLNGTCHMLVEKIR